MDKLDLEELVHLAIHASTQQRHDDAINYLKNAQEKQADNPHVTLLLAAEYAQIKMYERALDYFEKTTHLAPELLVARLQWGLLLMVLNRLDTAQEALSPLLELPSDNAYGLFASGLEALINRDITKAITQLNKGIEQNKENEPLNMDIQKIIDDIQQQQDTEQTEVDTGKNVNELLLSTYHQE